MLTVFGIYFTPTNLLSFLLNFLFKVETESFWGMCCYRITNALFFFCVLPWLIICHGQSRTSTQGRTLWPLIYGVKATLNHTSWVLLFNFIEWTWKMTLHMCATICEYRKTVFSPTDTLPWQLQIYCVSTDVSSDAWCTATVHFSILNNLKWTPHRYWMLLIWL